MAIGEPIYKKKQQQPWYVHGLYGSKSSNLSGSYWIKSDAIRAAQQLANEEQEAVTISGPKGMMIKVKPRRLNPNKWVKVEAIKFNKNGSVSLRK